MAGTIALGRGISGGLKSLGEGIARANEKKKQESQLATTLRKKLSILQPERKEEFNAMGLGDLAGEDIGHAEKVLDARRAKQEQREDLMMALTQQKLAAAKAAPAIFARLAESGQAPGSLPFDIAPEEFDRRTAPMDALSLMEAIAKSGAPIDLREAGGLMEALERMRQSSGTDGPLSFDEDPVSGSRFARSGKSVLPSGVNPAKLPANPDGASERTLSDGTVQSWNGTRWVNASRAPRVSPDFTKSLGELSMGIDDPKNGQRVRTGIKAMIDSAHTLKQLDDGQRSALYQQYGIGSQGDSDSPRSSPSGSLPTVTTAAEYQNLESGAEYIGKNGRKYRKP